MKIKNLQYISKRIFVFFLFALFFISAYSSVLALSQKRNENNRKKDDSPLKIYVAGIEIGKELGDLNPSKVEASFAFTMLMAQYFDIIPVKLADSISKSLATEGKPHSIADVANYFKANFIAYINLNRFVNIMRCDVTLLSGKDFSNKNTGTGYAFINYRDSADSRFLYDPSITLALQRAFAVAVKDSNLFAHLQKPVYPAISCVVSGIEFKNEENFPPWDIFVNKVVNSFFVCETIFKTASESNKYVVFDLDTRDSIYATFKFYAPENYKAPNQMELYALRKFEVKSFITGSLERDTTGATLNLILINFTNEGLTEVKRTKGSLAIDSKIELEALVTKLTKELFQIEEKKEE